MLCIGVIVLHCPAADAGRPALGVVDTVVPLADCFVLPCQSNCDYRHNAQVSNAPDISQAVVALVS